MAVTKNRLYVDIHTPISDIITAKQGDANSRFLDVSLTDGAGYVDLSAEAVVRMIALKPDGAMIYNNATITDAVNGRFQAELTNQTLAAAGYLEVEFKVFDVSETEVLTTPRFKVFIVTSLNFDEAIESTNEFGAVAVLFQDVADVREQIEEILFLLNQMDTSVISDVAALIGANTDAAGTSTLFARMAQIHANTSSMINSGVMTVKSVSRGYAIDRQSDDSGQLTITVPEFDPDRSDISYVGEVSSSAGANANGSMITLIGVTSTSLTFTDGSSASNRWSNLYWQITSYI